MNEQDLKNLILAKDLELYNVRQELYNMKNQLALAQKQVKELTSYLDQVTTPVKAEVTPEPVKNEKKSKTREVKFRSLTEEDLIKRYKNGSLSSVPYCWYHSRGMIVPDWARESMSKYIKERKSLRKTNFSTTR